MFDGSARVDAGGSGSRRCKNRPSHSQPYGQRYIEVRSQDPFLQKRELHAYIRLSEFNAVSGLDRIRNRPYHSPACVQRYDNVPSLGPSDFAQSDM